MITYVKQDLCKISHGIIIHGCNARGVMGAGVAKAIKEKWPIAFTTYKQHLLTHAHNNTSGLGTWSIVKVEDTLLGGAYVVNAITQLDYGRQPGRIYADVRAIEQSLDSIFQYVIETNLSDMPIYIPKIGCGYGGLDWDSCVRNIVEILDAKYSFHLYVCSL